jgi:hypothetical protein
MVMSDRSGRPGWVMMLRGVIAILFVAALLVGARSGVVLAKKQLPRSAEAELYPKGMRMRMNIEDGNALIGSESPARIRDYFFVVDAGVIEEKREQFKEMIRLSGVFDLELLDEDIDLVKVAVRSGPQRGVVLWVHMRQLPAPDERG